MPSNKSIYMETTKIAPERTAAEISSVLIQAGATSIQTEYEGRRIVGLKWAMKVHGQQISYSMPVRVEAITRLLTGRLSPLGISTTEKQQAAHKAAAENAKEQAERVAWRQLLRWVQAQLAMMDLGMVEAREVFLPYMLDRAGKTFYQVLEEQKFKMIEAPKQ